jgi:hypothetical protein
MKLRSSGIAMATLAVASTLLIAEPANAAPVTTAKSACAVVKAHIVSRWHIPMRAIAFCDVIPSDSSPHAFYVMALHGKRRDCTGICSTNMGWFAVRKTTGQVFEWDMAEQRPGLPLN